MERIRVFNTLFVLIVCSFAFLQPSYAQEKISEQITVPMSQPGNEGILRIDHYKGSIKVTGYDGDVIVVNASLRFKPAENENNGMRRIATNLIQLGATEKNNEVTIKSNSHSRTIDLDIMVPYQFSLKHQNYDNGIISVTKLNGEFEISNINGEILLEDISGSALLNTVDGNIKVAFKEISPNVPMAFSTIDGNIDLLFPANVHAIAKMKADQGEIFSDFDMEIQDRKQEVEKSSNGLYKVGLEEWTYAKINDGGPQFLIKTFTGNIYIHKQN